MLLQEGPFVGNEASTLVGDDTSVHRPTRNLKNSRGDIRYTCDHEKVIV